MDSELKYEAPSWDQMYMMLLNLADRIRKDKFKPDVIAGVFRGGWPQARVFSDLLSNPNLANVRAEFYVGVAETKDRAVLTQPVSVPIERKKMLTVDEVADTSRSLKLVGDHITERRATETRTVKLYCKQWSVLRRD